MEKGELVLRLSDNGCGFAASATNDVQNGNGLASIERRAAALGATLAVAAEPEQGVTVVLRVPIA